MPCRLCGSAVAPDAVVCQRCAQRFSAWRKGKRRLRARAQQVRLNRQVERAAQLSDRQLIKQFSL